jgi:hypothetical protein
MLLFLGKLNCAQTLKSQAVVELPSHRKSADTQHELGVVRRQQRHGGKEQRRANTLPLLLGGDEQVAKPVRSALLAVLYPERSDYLVPVFSDQREQAATS